MQFGLFVQGALAEGLQAPEMPQMPEMAISMPEMPEVPAMPEMPTMSTLEDISMPETLEMPEVPVMPSATDMPEIPAMPELSLEMPEIPEMPEMLVMPEMPEIPELELNMPQMPEMPAIPEISCPTCGIVIMCPTCPTCNTGCPIEIHGCMNPNALNFNPLATINDSSCIFPPVISGCTDATALNYNPLATNDDGSCQYSPCAPPEPINGCTDSTASNYNPNAEVDDGSCIFPPVPKYTISGMKWNDLDKDGVKDSNEPTLSGWTISLTGNAQASITTDSNGSYLFSNLLAGTYTVCEIQKDGWLQSYPAINNGCHTLQVGSGSKDNVNFGNYEKPCPPPVVPGCTNSNATNYNPLATVDNGTCIFPPKPLVIKAFKVVCENESDLPNWSTTEAVSSIDENTAANYVAQSNGKCHLESDWQFQWGFGDKNYETPQFTEGVDKLPGDFVGLADGTVSVCSKDCGPSTKTGSNYNDWKTFNSTVEIADLQGSTSRIWVREVQKEGYIPFTNSLNGPTEDNISAEIYCHNDILNYDNYDFVLNPELGKTYYCIAFNALKKEVIHGCTNSNATNYNPLATVDNGTCIFPTPKYTISGMKWNDLDKDGVKDDGEQGLESWTITLTGDTQASTTTDSSGHYSFVNLLAGTYTVCETQKTNWIQSYPTGNNGCHSIVITNESKSGINFGNYEAVIPPPPPLGCTVNCGGGGIMYPLLRIEKTVNPESARPGDTVTYTIKVRNIGFNEAINLNVKDILPDGFKYVDSDVTGEWTLGNLQIDAVQTLTFKVKVPDVIAWGTYTNKAEAKANNHETVTATASLKISDIQGGEAEPTLSVKKTSNKDFIKPGSYFLWTIEVKNNGNAPAINVVLEDILPAGFVGDGGLTTVVWHIPLIEKGGIATKVLTTYVQSNVKKGVYENTATAYAENYPNKVTGRDSVSVVTELPWTAGPSEPLNWKAVLKMIINYYLPSISFQEEQKQSSVKNATVQPTGKTYSNYLDIPSIGVHMAIVQGNNESALNKGAWLLPLSPLPDEFKNTSFAAHRYLYRPPSPKTFYLLDKVQVGDPVTVYWNGIEYRYEVFSTTIVEPSDLSVLEPGNEPIVTLITCTPLFSDKNRLIVRAKLIEKI
jgi:LPXTG-site transpeptidase (sortase) family protein